MNFRAPATPEEYFYFAAGLVVTLSTFLTLLAVLIDFIEFQARGGVKRERKSVVATGTMMLFFFGFYSVIRFGAGRVPLAFSPLKAALMTAGALLVAAGCAVNIKGRFDLGKNWADQIKIYGDHTFISGGAYRFVRHPLYASLVWMFLGASLIYTNWLAFLANAFIFIPFMRHRALLEEELLAKEFPDYETYRSEVGMFFPKLSRRKK
jgi:protein-S-isoprenylcysteine O-methyltransferase Ste14